MYRFNSTLIRKVCIPLFGLLSFSATADILANYDFEGDLVSSDIDTGSTAADFQIINIVPDEDADNLEIGLSGAGNLYLRSSATGTGEAGALADDDVFAFTISVVDPVTQRLDLENLSFSFINQNAVASSSFTNNVYVQSSVGGVGTGNPVLFTDSITNGSVSSSTDNDNTVDLSAATFDSLTTITFQFRFSDNQDNAGYLNRLDDVVLNGAVTTIPEPSALIMVGLGLITCLTVSRRKR